MPFRQAHEVAGKVVQHCLGVGKRIEELSLAELRRFSNKIEKDIYRYLSAEVGGRAAARAGRHGEKQRGAPAERTEGLNETTLVAGVAVGRDGGSACGKKGDPRAPELATPKFDYQFSGEIGRRSASR